MLTLGTANAAIRFGYGAAALVAPSRPAAGKVRLAPHTEHFPEARLFIRGFAAHQLAVGLLGLEGSGSPPLRRPAMLLAAATDLADIAAAVVEARSRHCRAPVVGPSDDRLQPRRPSSDPGSARSQ
jgi:hypothetical protein